MFAIYYQDFSDLTLYQNLDDIYIMASDKKQVSAKSADIAETQLCGKGYQHLSSLEVWSKMENYFLTF